MPEIPIKNKSTIMTTKSTNGNLIPLYPTTTKEQVLGWDIGEAYGPYIFYLNQWTGKQCTLPLTGLTSNDIVKCVKILYGTKEEMILQDQAYSLLDPIIGVESLNNEIRFTCTNETPQNIVLKVQVSWTR